MYLVQLQKWWQVGKFVDMQASEATLASRSQAYVKSVYINAYFKPKASQLIISYEVLNEFSILTKPQF